MTASPAFSLARSGQSEIPAHLFSGDNGAGAFYDSPVFEQVLKAVTEDIRSRARLIVVTGETGTGKTLLVHQVIAGLDGNVTPILLIDSLCTFPEFVQFACKELHLAEPETDALPEGEIKALREYLIAQRGEGRSVVVFIDEAQEMSEELLVDLLLFSDSPAPGDELLQFVLIGLPNFQDFLGRPALHELTHKGLRIHTLLPLPRNEAVAFIRHRLGGFSGEALFSAEALETIATYSHGIPRSINKICSLALFTAELEQRRPITGEFIDEVAERFPLTVTGQSARTGDTASSGVIDTPKADYSNTPAKTPASPEHNVRLIRLVDPESEQEQTMSRVDNLNKILKNLQSESPGVEASALISEDGLMISSALPQDLDDTRVAGMTATLLNLGTRAAVELRRGDVQEVIVRGELGYAVMISAGRGVLLLVLANEHSKLGLIFFDMREAIKAIKTVL